MESTTNKYLSKNDKEQKQLAAKINWNLLIKMKSIQWRKGKFEICETKLELSQKAKEKIIGM